MNRKHERDDAVDQLLRRSSVVGGAAQGSDSCLDAETFAAWMDGGLDDDTRALAETHASACTRCQALMAALVRSQPEAVERAPWWRASNLRWAVPLTAAAAAAVLWIVVPANRSTVEQPQTQSRAAEEKPAAAFEDRLASPPPAAVTPQSKAADRAAVKGEIASARPSDTRQLQKRVAEADTPRARERSVPSAPPTPVTAPSTPVAGAASQDALGARRLSESIAIAIPEIVSPDPMFRWRLAPDGFVQYSANGGTTWELVPTGVSTPLTAGSSPSPSICWLVGQAGAVLRTTDGRRWERVPFPEAVDLVAVQAVDARSAVVTAADGRTFRTTDGGTTWTRATPQDF